MNSQTPKPVAYLLRVTSGKGTGSWVMFDSNRILYGERGESRRAVQIRWHRQGVARPIIQRQRDVASRAEAEQCIVDTRSQLAGSKVSSAPNYFIECCRAVKRRMIRAGYRHAGRALAGHLSAERPGDISHDAWQEALQQLWRLVGQADHLTVLAWLDRYFPACMALIPQRRRKAVLRGIYDVIRDTDRATGGRP
jgi:hypothetical protein